MAKKIGILGFGKLGTVLASLAVKAGYQVFVSASSSPDKIKLTAAALVPGAIPLFTEDMLTKTDVVILAFPLGKYKQLKSSLFKDKIIIDATNYWWESDGIRNDLQDPLISTSELIRDHLAAKHFVKAFNHIGYHDLLDYADQKNPKKAIAIAGDDQMSLAQTAQIVLDFGFQPLLIGSLHQGIMLQPGSNVFGANLDKKTLGKALMDFKNSDWGQKVVHVDRSSYSAE